MKSLAVETKILDPSIAETIPLPSYATAGSAALDLRACLKRPVRIQPGDTELIGSGIAINIKDPNIVGIIAPRSGLGIKHGIVMANTIGVIDSDYQGEIKMGLFNRSRIAYTIRPGERVCQMLFMPVIHVTLKLVHEFSTATHRGSGGLGHTGRQ